MTEKQVRQLLKKHNKSWKEFGKFMRGQTVGLNDDGLTDYYDCDVNHFLGQRDIMGDVMGRCAKCGDRILSDEDSLCGGCV